eukprot:UN01220
MRCNQIKQHTNPKFFTDIHILFSYSGCIKIVVRFFFFIGRLLLAQN